MSAQNHVLAYSGGLDSTVLLHLAGSAALPGLKAVHVHHGLQAQADAWAAHCQQQCATLGVPLALLRVSIASDDPQGPEAAARAARYAALAQHLSAGAVLLTAHHQQDQAETLLLRLLRGTGVEGMAAMRALTPFAQGQLWRPLLGVPKSALKSYADEHGLRWIEDPHNAQPRFARSWLRADVMPLLRTRVPQADALFARAAQHAGEAAITLAEVAEQDLATARLPGGALSIRQLQQLRAARCDASVRHWLGQCGLPAPTFDMMEKLHSEIFAARPDAEPLLAWPGGEFRRYRDALHASAPLAAEPGAWCADWNASGILMLPPGCGVLRSHETAVPRDSILTVRFAQGGERIKTRGREHHKTLKLLAQEAGIPPWVRRRMPLLFEGAELLSVAGIWEAAGAPRLHWHCPELPGAPAARGG